MHDYGVEGGIKHSVSCHGAGLAVFSLKEPGRATRSQSEDPFFEICIFIEAMTNS